FREWKRRQQEVAAAETFAEDAAPELRELGRSELGVLRERAQGVEAELKRLLLPRDPRDERNVILEIRAGTGGEEASLFAADLFRMYARYAERRGWEGGTKSSNATGVGGFKEIIALIQGQGAFRPVVVGSGGAHA